MPLAGRRVASAGSEYCRQQETRPSTGDGRVLDGSRNRRDQARLPVRFRRRAADSFTALASLGFR